VDEVVETTKTLTPYKVLGLNLGDGVQPINFGMISWVRLYGHDL